MPKYLLGIDGGGSKTEFVVSDVDLRTIARVQIDRGSNPWNCGLEPSLQVLREGLSQLESYRSDIAGAAAGISGCFSQNQYTEPMLAALTDFYPDAELVGDVTIGFRALSPQASGIIAIAGTGSAVTQFFGDGTHYLYDAIGVGGRDLGYTLAMAYKRSTLDGSAGRTFLAELAPVLNSGQLQLVSDYYQNEELRRLSQHLHQLSQRSTTFRDLRPWIDMAVDRWVYKLHGIVHKFLQKEPSATLVPVVLSGGFWHFDYLRQQVMTAVEGSAPAAKFFYNPAVRPVIGALKIAKGQLESESE